MYLQNCTIARERERKRERERERERESKSICYHGNSLMWLGLYYWTCKCTQYIVYSMVGRSLSDLSDP